VRDLPARDTGLGLWVLDVEPAAVGEGAAIVFTLHWTTRDTWEGRDFTVLVRPAGDRPA
jgi:hypothetical protein